MKSVDLINHLIWMIEKVDWFDKSTVLVGLPSWYRHDADEIVCLYVQYWLINNLFVSIVYTVCISLKVSISIETIKAIIEFNALRRK